MAQDRFRLHGDFRRLGPTQAGGNATILAALVPLVAAGQSLAITTHPTLRADPLLASGGAGPLLSCQTSGSTGQPKRILRTQTSWLLSFQENRLGFGLTPADRYAILGSLGSSLCSYAAIEAMHLGTGLIDLCDLGPARQLRGLREMAASVLYCSPAQLRLLLAAARGPDAQPLPALRHILCGGGKLDDQSLRAATGLFPAASIREFYGAAETSFITLSDADTPQGSVGRAYPGVRIGIRDAQGRPTDGPGEIWVESPYLFLRYAEGGAGDTRRDGGALTVGELGRLDAQGNLFLSGRLSRMVTVADTNVFPEEIEAHLLTLPGITQCAVLTLPDRMRGHAVIAVISGIGDPARIEAVRQSCRERLGAAATPRKILFVPQLPMLASGKPDLIALRAGLESQP